MTTIDTVNASTRTSIRRTGSWMAPVKPSVVSSHQHTNEPTMKISPWAKLISSMIP